MNAKQITVLSTAVAAVLLVVIVTQFARQSGLEEESGRSGSVQPYGLYSNDIDRLDRRAPVLTR